MSDKRLNIDWPRTIAGALAAVGAAVLLSKLGAAGTLIGAALGSMVISIGTNIGAHGIQSTRQRMLEAQREAADRVSEAQAEVRNARAGLPGALRRSEEHLAAAEHALESSKADLNEEMATAEIPVVVDDGIPAQPIRRPWRRIAAFTVASFALAILMITGFELISGKPLLAYTGGRGSGTTFSNLGGGSNSSKSATTPAPSPVITPVSSSSTSPSPSATVTVTVTPSSSPSPTDTTSPTATTSATSTAMTSPTATPTP